MIILPQRLFDSSDVQVVLRSQNCCVLHKTLSAPVLQREGYISNHVISIILEGQQILHPFEKNKIIVNKGEVIFIPRGMYYVTDLLSDNNKFESLLFFFDESQIEKFLSETSVSEFDRKSNFSHLKFEVNKTIQLFAKSVIDIYGNKDSSTNDVFDIKIQELLHLINRLYDNQSFVNFLFTLTLPSKRNIRSFMENNYDKPLKIEDYAYLTGRSVSTFRRDFKRIFDLPPNKWMRQKRMNRALELIEAGASQVNNIAAEVGYDNISYFIKSFKEEVGMSPKQYMNHRNYNDLQH